MKTTAIVIAVGLTALFLLILWSVRRHRSPTLNLACHADITTLAPSLAGLSLGKLVQGNHVEIVRDHYFFEEVERLAQAAKHTFHLENFLWKDGQATDRLVKTLCETAQRGVVVRILLDGIGSRLMHRRTRERLRRSGCHVAFFHRWSLSNLGVLTDRDHRKIIVCDGREAIVGGHCYTDAWLAEFNRSKEKSAFDISLIVTGPIVHTIQAVFSENWAGETGELFTGDTVFPPLSDAGRLTMHAAYCKPERSAPAVKILHHSAICMARDRIWIQNPYFLPKPEAIDAFGAAVSRGVDVRVLMPSLDATDNPIVNFAARRNYGKLMRCGVKLFEVERGLLHQKVMTVDGVWSAVGSCNFDDRSFDTNEEITLGIFDAQLTARLDGVFEEYLHQRVRQVDLKEWERRPMLRRLQEHAAYCLRQLL